MSNYGLKVAKDGESAFSTDLTDLQLTTAYPFAKIDPTNTKSFQTITTTILNNPADNTLVNFYSFPHGYDYIPQAWGVWNVTGPVAVVSQYDNAYGTFVSTTGIDGFYMYYAVDATNVNLYLYKFVTVGPVSLVGVVAQLTMYVFVDDLQITP